MRYHITQLVAPIDMLFIPSPLEFDGVHDDVKNFVVQQLYRKLFKKLAQQTQCKFTIATLGHE